MCASFGGGGPKSQIFKLDQYFKAIHFNIINAFTIRICLLKIVACNLVYLYLL